jgi:thiamine-monophosphate kinase
MGAEPDALLVGLALPAETELDGVIELYEGLAEPGVPVAGGDTTAAPVLTLSVAAMGRSERVPGRAGALAGDRLVVTGPLGGSAAGLHALKEGLGGFDELVERHRRPPLRLQEGRRLARIAHAMVDLSDGIAGDAARIAERSGCRIVLEAEQIPRAPRSEEVADLPFWTMGEDYELLAAVAPEDADELGLPVVGRCEEGAGVEVRLEGRTVDVSGWDALRP